MKFGIILCRNQSTYCNLPSRSKKGNKQLIFIRRLHLSWRLENNLVLFLVTGTQNPACPPCMDNSLPLPGAAIGSNDHGIHAWWKAKQRLIIRRLVKRFSPQVHVLSGIFLWGYSYRQRTELLATATDVILHFVWQHLAAAKIDFILVDQIKRPVSAHFWVANKSVHLG